MEYPFAIEPQYYTAFDSEDEMIERCKEWGLLSEKATRSKTFYYKGNGMNIPCSILGYADDMTAVIGLDNGQKHCIHPSYLKEMQASGYAVKNTAAQGTEVPEDDTVKEAAEDPQEAQESAAPEAAQDIESPVQEVSVKEPAKPKATKAKTPKFELPEGKVKMTATVKEFTTVPNHFSDNDDEIVVYEAAAITDADPEITVGEVWSSYSATLKKQELEVGDRLTFEAKIIKKKLTKHPVAYKINNPAKIQKVQD
ncbi:hypothetical protein C2I18_17700 [Paenibacillus sp. PK3_47]|nr:hypothetical protein C2I18_17700 [Paenibacillus sp. PK3_47]